MKLSDLGGNLCFMALWRTDVAHIKYCMSTLCPRCSLRQINWQEWKNVEVHIGVDIPLMEEETKLED